MEVCMMTPYSNQDMSGAAWAVNKHHAILATINERFGSRVTQDTLIAHCYLLNL